MSDNVRDTQANTSPFLGRCFVLPAIALAAAGVFMPIFGRPTTELRRF